MNLLRSLISHMLFTAGMLCLCSFILPTTAIAQQVTTQHTAKSMPVMAGHKPPGMARMWFAHWTFNQLEDRAGSHGQEFRWDGEGWIGTDMNKLWVKSEGVASNGSVSDGDQEFLYDRPIPRLRYFDAQVGVREDLDSGPARTWAAIGIEGLAPYYFEFAPTLYIGRNGDVAGRIQTSYQLLFTQRLIAEPEAELNFYGQDDPARGVGSGLSEIDTGIRLRYEFSRKFAPYIGFAYNGKYGDTAMFARQDGEPTSNPSFVFGLRLWR